MFKFIIFPGILLKVFKTRLLIIIKEINQNSRGKYFLSLLTTLQQPEELLSACIHDNRCDQSDLGHQSWSSWSPTFSDSHVTTAISYIPFTVNHDESKLVVRHVSWMVMIQAWTQVCSLHFHVGFQSFSYFCIFWMYNFFSFFRKSSRGQAWNHKCPDETTDQMFGRGTACRQTGPRWGVRRKLQDTRTCPSGKTNQGEPHFARTVVADDLPPQALTGSIQ